MEMMYRASPSDQLNDGDRDHKEYHEIDTLGRHDVVVVALLKISR